jgi:hypothetical protein
LACRAVLTLEDEENNDDTAWPCTFTTSILDTLIIIQQKFEVETIRREIKVLVIRRRVVVWAGNKFPIPFQF